MPEQPVQDGYCLVQTTYEGGRQTFDIMPAERFAAKRRDSRDPDKPDDISFFCKLTAEQAEAHLGDRLFIFDGRYAHQKPDLLIGEDNKVGYCLVSELGRAGEPSVIPVTDYNGAEYHVLRLLTMREQAAHESGKLNVKKGEKGPLVDIVDE